MMMLYLYLGLLLFVFCSVHLQNLFCVMQLEDFGFSSVFDGSYYLQVTKLKFASHAPVLSV